MVSAVKSRPNHYETLGLTPTASSDEIAQAFAREVSQFRPRPFGGVAHVSIAYETLRDPAKRRAYDAALGLNPEPEPLQSPSTWRIGAHFMGTASVDSLVRHDDGGLPPLARQAASRPRPEPTAELRLPAFLAASLREPAIPDAPDTASAPTQSEPQRLKPDVGDLYHARRARMDSSALDVDESPMEWQPSAMTAGGVVLAVAFLAAVAGWSTEIAEVPQEAVPVVTTALPVAKSPSKAGAAEAPDQSPYVEVARTERLRRAKVAAVHIEPAPPPPPSAATAEQPAEVAQSGQSQVAESATEQAAAKLPSVAAVSANLPLPNRVIARAIGRIGYACGQVASTAPVDGAAPGVFRITCTSGHSYRAAPVRGRYRFSRWGGQ